MVVGVDGRSLDAGFGLSVEIGGVVIVKGWDGEAEVSVAATVVAAGVAVSGSFGADWRFSLGDGFCCGGTFLGVLLWLCPLPRPLDPLGPPRGR